MAALPAYLDECIDYHIVAALQLRGFDVRHVYDERTSGADDDVQLEHAARHGWAFVTQNQREFLRRHYAWLQHGRRHRGLLLFPQPRSARVAELRVAFLLDWVAASGFSGSFLARWADLQVRLRQGYRVDPKYSEAEVQIALGWRPPRV